MLRCFELEKLVTVMKIILKSAIDINFDDFVLSCSYMMCYLEQIPIAKEKEMEHIIEGEIPLAHDVYIAL